MSYQLEDLIQDEGLRKKLQDVRVSAKGYLQRIRQVFPEYTPHDISHKYKVVENLSKLIPIDLAKRFLPKVQGILSAD